MLKIGLMHEFSHEVENTRKLLKAIPNDALGWRPSDKNWTLAELASHIVSMYAWYPYVLNQPELAVDTLPKEKPDISSIEKILETFEKNAALAKATLENFDESQATASWKMTAHGNIVIPPMPKVAVLRTLLFNHVYHHRGELVVYLRCTGNKVPGLYGPSADEK